MADAPVLLFDAKEQKLIQGLGTACSAISFVASLAVITSWIKFAELRKFSFTLIMMMAISDLGSGIGWFIGSPLNGTNACVTQGLFVQFFQLASILWTICVAYVMDASLKQQDMPHIRRFHVFVWGAAFLFASPPLIHEANSGSTLSYGNTQGTGWCWIDTTNVKEFDTGTAWRFFGFYIPLWLAIGYNLRVYLSIYRRFKALLQEALGNEDIRASGRSRAKDALVRIKRLQRYPMIMIIAWCVYHLIICLCCERHTHSPSFPSNRLDCTGHLAPSIGFTTPSTPSIRNFGCTACTPLFRLSWAS
jgi:hypothetical protein